MSRSVRDERGHLRDVLGRPRQDVGRADAQLVEVGQEARDMRRGQLVERAARGREVRMIRSSTSVMFITQVTL